MIRNIRKIIMLIIMLVGIYFYSIVDNTEALYDINTSTKEYGNTGVIFDDELKQTIIPREDQLDGIEIKCGLIGDCSAVTVQYWLTDEEGRIVGKGEKPAIDLKDKKLCKFSFEPIFGCKGKRYDFCVKETGASEENGVSFYIDLSSQDMRVSVRRDDIQGSLVAKMVNHRFDLKTYFIVVCLLAYLYMFILILNKLFK